MIERIKKVLNERTLKLKEEETARVRVEDKRKRSQLKSRSKEVLKESGVLTILQDINTEILEGCGKVGLFEEDFTHWENSFVEYSSSSGSMVTHRDTYTIAYMERE